MWIESRNRFIQQQRLRGVQVSAADGQLLSHASRQLTDQRLTLWGELKRFEQLESFGIRICHLIRARRESQILLDR